MEPKCGQNRRRWLLNAAALWVPGAFAESLARTPRVEEGPFYPRQLPLDTDNDLLVVNNSLTPSVGEVTLLSGKLLDSRGEAVRNATIEIWQVDQNGIYFKQGGTDPNFQGYGRFLTGSSGEYAFRTIKPVPYKGRPAPHIHFKIRTKGHEPWTTQLFVKGAPGNARDGLYRRIGDAAMQERVTVDFRPGVGTELTAKFDIVLGWTPEG
jgi:protocatechuate 3,4-dioxygenase, beta subunit